MGGIYVSDPVRMLKLALWGLVEWEMSFWVWGLEKGEWGIDEVIRS